MTDGEALGAPNPSVTYVVPPGSERLLNNVRFYEAFGSSFFFHKLRSLEVALTPAGIEAAVSGDAESGTPEGRAAFARDIRAEIHFTAIHNIETVIYLMLSVYSRGVPMVIYMNLAKDVKQSVQDLKEEKFSKLSKQSTTDKRFFYRQCLLTGLEETLPVISQVLSDSIDMLETCVNIYVIGLEAYINVPLERAMDLRPGLLVELLGPEGQVIASNPISFNAGGIAWILPDTG